MDIPGPIRALLVAAFVLAAGTALTAAVGAANGRAIASVNVTLIDFGIRLSSGTVPPGRISFRVLNRGNVAHDFAVGGEKTRVLAHGQRQSILVDLSRTGAYRFRWTGASRYGTTKRFLRQSMPG